jgi:hypothetical protein
MEMAVRAKFGGVSRILAQAPVVSAAPGRWLRSVPMIAPLFVIFALGYSGTCCMQRGCCLPAANAPGAMFESRLERVEWHSY